MVKVAPVMGYKVFDKQQIFLYLLFSILLSPYPIRILVSSIFVSFDIGYIRFIVQVFVICKRGFSVFSLFSLHFSPKSLLTTVRMQSRTNPFHISTNILWHFSPIQLEAKALANQFVLL